MESTLPGSNNTSSNNAKLQHVTLYFFVIFCVLLTFPQAIKAIIALTNHQRPEEDYHHRRLFTFLIVLTTLSLVATYALGAVITVSKFDSDFTVSQAVHSMYGFAKEVAIEFFYTGLLLLPAYRGTARASLTSRLAFGFLTVMILSTIINAPVTAVASTPNMVTASIGIQCVHFVAYFLLTILIVLWSIHLHRNSRLPTLPRELALFDRNVLSNIVTLMLPCITIRAAFELISLLVGNQSEFRRRISGAGFELATIIIEGSTFFVMVTVALGLGSAPVRRSSPEGGATVMRGGSQIQLNADYQVPKPHPSRAGYEVEWLSLHQQRNRLADM